jgi:hypothetical protein
MMECGLRSALKEYLQTSLGMLKAPAPQHLRPPGMSATTVSSHAVVEEGAVVEESIVMPGAVIRSGARVRSSIIGWDVTVAGEAHGVALAPRALGGPGDVGIGDRHALRAERLISTGMRGDHAERLLPLQHGL